MAAPSSLAHVAACRLLCVEHVEENDKPCLYLVRKMAASTCTLTAAVVGGPFFMVAESCLVLVLPHQFIEQQACAKKEFFQTQKALQQVDSYLLQLQLTSSDNTAPCAPCAGV